MLKVSRNGYYCFLKATPSKRSQENKLLLEKIKLVHQENRQVYGSPRIHAELQARNETCSRKHVAKLMKNAGLKAKMKKSLS